jgi:FixJ family two-component response regulator
VAGLANKVIASRLDISVRTVENHRQKIFQKMKADSLAELVRMSISAGVITDSGISVDNP